MGSCCCKLFGKQRADENSQLRQDSLHFPEQCSCEEESHDDGLAGDFVDLREDALAVQCTEPSEVNVPRRRPTTFTLFLEFYAAVRFEQEH